MSVLPKDISHDRVARRYSLQLEGGVAIADYRREGDKIILNHTVVPPALQGKGAASRLIKAVLDDARGEGLKVVPLCSFVADYIDRHPEEQDLLAE